MEVQVRSPGTGGINKEAVLAWVWDGHSGNEGEVPEQQTSSCTNEPSPCKQMNPEAMTHPSTCVVSGSELKTRTPRFSQEKGGSSVEIKLRTPTF